MKNNVVAAFLNKSLSDHIHELKIIKNDQILLRGNGRIFFDEEGLFTVEICAPTENGENPQSLPALHPPVFFSGKLAEFQREIRGEINGAQTRYCRVSSQRWLKMRIDKCSLINESFLHYEQTKVFGVINEFPKQMGFSLEIQTSPSSNEFFSDSVIYPVLRFKYNQNKFALRRTLENWGEVSGLIEGVDESVISKLCVAVIDALSLLWGYKMHWLVLITQVGSKK